MTIKYANGTGCKAVLLSHEHDEIRALLSGSDDVEILRRLNGTWFSEQIEPVVIDFEWHTAGPTTPPLNDCVCSKELAGRLIRSLLAASEGDDPAQCASALPN
jgi:hypothetical protein